MILYEIMFKETESLWSTIHDKQIMNNTLYTYITLEQTNSYFLLKIMY